MDISSLRIIADVADLATIRLGMIIDYQQLHACEVVVHAERG
jgi:hypothetical protein